MDFYSASNYYERLVRDYLAKLSKQKPHLTDKDLIEDIVCIALNKLPPRYFRHEIDMAFHLGKDERERMEANVCQAVDLAIKKVNNGTKRPLHETGNV